MTANWCHTFAVNLAFFPQITLTSVLFFTVIFVLATSYRARFPLILFNVSLNAD